MRKKLIVSAFAVIAVLIILVLPYRINDAACSAYRDEIVDEVSLIPEINVLQVVNGCGNSSGTGDHTDLYVAILVETKLSKEALENKIAPVSFVHDVKEKGSSTLAMEIIGLSFNQVSFNSGENCYILEFRKKSPCSAFDMRGV